MNIAEAVAGDGVLVRSLADNADGNDDLAANPTTNLTRLTAEILNYTHNFLDVGLPAAPVSPAATPSPLLLPHPTAATTTLAAAPLYATPFPLPSSANAVMEAVFAILANASNATDESGIAAANATASPTLPADTLLIEDDEIRLSHAPQLSQSTMIKVYVLSVMAVLSLFGNVLTMWNIYKTRITRRSSRHSWSAIYSLIFHLSIADVLVTGFCIIGEAAWAYTVQWLADEITCKMVKLFQMFSLYLSTYVLVLIGVDRWIAVKYPMKSLNMAKRCYRLLGGTYILSLLLSLPQFFIFHVARGPFIEEFHQCVTHGFYTAPWQEQFYTTFTLIFTFLLPLCILFITYLSSFCTISSSEKMFQGSKLATYSSKPAAQTNRQRLIHKAKMKSLRISVVIIFAFIICWTPYYVMMIIFMFSNPDKRLSEGLNSVIFAFGMSNSLVNPLIYGAFHLCPMKRKTSRKGGNNNAYSLNRGDSQRTPSMLTAVTQIDANGRQRTYRQPSYCRTHSNGSNSKEHVSLLQVTPTPTLMRKSNSLRNPHFVPQYHTHSSSLVCNGSGSGSGNGNGDGSGANSHSTVVFSYNNPRGGSVATLRANSSGTLGLAGVNHVVNGKAVASAAVAVAVAVASSGRHRMSADESVSSV